MRLNCSCDHGSRACAVDNDGRKKIVFNACVIAAVLFPALALGDCVDGVRKATPREAVFSQSVQEKLKEALPAPPPGWTVAHEPSRTLGGLCTGTPEGSFAVRVSAKYTCRFPKEELRSAVEKAKLERLLHYEGHR